jgi:pyruvate dehydrogenase complex dehydrogenase (E1) component
MLGGDLLEEIRAMCLEQDRLYQQWEERTILAAEEEKEYQILMRQRAMVEKDNKIPTTFIAQFIRGDEDVAEKRKKRDIAEELKEITKNRITDLRKRIEVTSAQAGREWTRRDDNFPDSAGWFE